MDRRARKRVIEAALAAEPIPYPEITDRCAAATAERVRGRSSPHCAGDGESACNGVAVLRAGVRRWLCGYHAAGLYETALVDYDVPHYLSRAGRSRHGPPPGTGVAGLRAALISMAVEQCPASRRDDLIAVEIDRGGLHIFARLWLRPRTQPHSSCAPS